MVGLTAASCREFCDVTSACTRLAVVVDVVAREALDVIVKEELAVLAGQTPEEQETQLPTLLARVEARAADASEAKGYRFGDISRAVVESTRGEVRRRTGHR